MANSTTNVDPILPSQASKEVTANAFFDAASQAITYGRRASTSSGLTWGYYGGNVRIAAGTLSQIANGTVSLTASATNYIVAAKATGAVGVSTATTNWDNSTDYWRLYSIVTGASTVTSWTDARMMAQFTQDPGGGGGGGITALTGDVTASGSGSVVATIANDAVTYAKLQNISAQGKILGRSSSGAGDAQEIDILGTVAQSGGVPTGAIFERGSNANGEYIKYADGTLVCTFDTTAGSVTTASGSLFVSTTFNWTFPAVFSTLTHLVPSGTSFGGGGRYITGVSLTTSIFGYAVLGPVSSATATSTRLQAIGRWF